MVESLTPLAAAPTVTLTALAEAKVAALLAAEGEDLALRIAAQPGGCAGLRYQLFFDDETLDGDVETRCGAVRVVLDRDSVPYLVGATIDFAETLQRPGFVIDNPNAVGCCACGDSCP